MTEPPWVPPGSTTPQAAPGAPVPPGPPAASAQPPGGPGGPGWLPPSQAPYARMDFRPGIVPLRPLQIGDLYGGVLKAVRGNPGATIGLATLTSLAFLVPATALGSWLAGQSGLSLLDDGSGAASDTLPDGFGLGTLGVYLPSIGQVLSAILLAGFLAHVVGQAVLGHTVTMGQTWTATRGRLPAMAGAVLVATGAFALVALVTLGIPIGLLVYAEAVGGESTGLAVLLIALGVLALVAALAVLSTRWAFATPAIVLERVGVGRGLTRSWALVGGPLTGPFWRIFGLRLLTAIIVGTAASVITIPLMIVFVIVLVVTLGEDGDGSTFFVLQTVFSGVVGLITGALTTPFTAGVDALLYIDARIRREGLDVALIQTAQGAAAPPWSSSAP